MMSSPGRLLLHNPTSEFVESDLVMFVGGIVYLTWLG